MNNDFLRNINAPALNSSTFANDLREVFQNIDDNFKKIVSAPYLEGQEGRSIESYDMPIVENNVLTEFGLGMVRTIFGNDNIESFEDIDNIAPQIGAGENHAYTCLLQENNGTMKVFRSVDPNYIVTDENSEWICSAEYYYFIDMRIEDLGRVLNPSQENFTDYSCMIFAEWTGTEWVFTKGNMMPTLYYSPNQQHFCWQINNIQTEILAQGIKGDAGKAPISAVVRGNGYSYLSGEEKILNVFCSGYLSTTITTNGTETVGVSNWLPISGSGLMDGDLVACVFDMSDGTYNTTYPDMVIANIRKIGEGASAVYLISATDDIRMSRLWTSYILFNGFRDIDYKSTDKNKTKAIFVPTKPKTVNSIEKNVVHAMFQDDSKVNYSESHGEWSVVDTGTERDLVFKKVLEERLVGSNSVGNQNKMSSKEPYTNEQTKVKFIQYDMEVDGSAKASVSGIPNTILGVPVGSVISWVNLNNVPDGWAVVGNVDDTNLHNKVFRLQFDSPNSTDYDLNLVRNGTDISLAKARFIDLREGFSQQRNSDFMNLFSVISAYPIEESNGKRYVVMDTTQTSFSSFISYASYSTFGWGEFEMEKHSSSTPSQAYIDFYLTKYIGE